MDENEGYEKVNVDELKEMELTDEEYSELEKKMKSSNHITLKEGECAEIGAKEDQLKICKKDGKLDIYRRPNIDEEEEYTGGEP